MLLADYQTGVRDLLHDPNANFYSASAVDRWINRARRQVAQKGRCVRLLPPTRRSITSITLTSGGAGYTTPPTVTLSAPDANSLNNVQATAVANISSGQVTGFTMTNFGAGYVAPPTATLTGGGGTGASGTPVVPAHITTVPGQEVYNLGTIATAIDTLYPGLGTILGVQSISVSWGSVRPTLKKRDFSWLQAYARSASMIYQNYPRIWAPYGQGVTGSFYLWPVPQAYNEMEVDCYFSVLDLSVSQTVDLIPEPWDEPVMYYAAYLAYLNAQRMDDARAMLSEHERLMVQARGVVSTDTTPDPYGED